MAMATLKMLDTKGSFGGNVFSLVRVKIPGGDTWVFFGWVCAARDSKLAPRSRKHFP